MPVFSEYKGNFGFGCMRLPMRGDEVDIGEFCRMTDAFLAAGFHYFDTAHGYIGGKSETAIRAALTSRYPRNAYFLTDKLTAPYFNREEDIRPFFESQLAACGVSYFDFYLMHAQNRDNFEKFRRCRAYETAFDLKKEGKIRHVGLSFHDTAEVLDRILSTYPAIEAVQLQLNYADWDDPAVQSRLCLDVCRKHGKPVIVMEPVKGGTLVNLPAEASEVFASLGDASAASYALRFAAGCGGVFMVLSGMSNMAQMEDNIASMRDFRPLDDREHAAVREVCRIFRAAQAVACTGCRYCTDGCPKHIPIPDIFTCINDAKMHRDGRPYDVVCGAPHGRASDCIGCGRCEKACPQHLPVRALLRHAAEEFEKT